MAIILKYTKSVYQGKVDSLMRLNTQLNDHLETLEGLKNQIQSFWDANQTGRFITAISAAIARVRQASQNVESLQNIYQETIDEQARMETAVDDVLGEIDKSVDRVIEVASFASKFDV